MNIKSYSNTKIPVNKDELKSSLHVFENVTKKTPIEPRINLMRQICNVDSFKDFEGYFCRKVFP